jgi:hypothetical protein
MNLTGSLAPSGTPPVATDPCIPFGTWTVNVTLADMADCTNVEFDAQYVYQVTENITEETWEYAYPADPDNENIKLKVTANGSSCAGNFEHWSDDGKTLIMIKPFEDNLTITGTGYFELYSVNQLQ